MRLYKREEHASQPYAAQRVLRGVQGLRYGHSLRRGAGPQRILTIPRALALIREAFEALRKTGYNIRVELGRKSDYLSNGELYEHAEESGLFEFRDDL